MRNVLDKHYLRTLNLRDTTLILIENLKFANKKLKDFEESKKWSELAIVILLIIINYSGFAWYNKVQKIQDQILKNEAILKENQVRELNKKSD